MGVAIVECEVTAVPHLVSTIPGIKLKIPSLITPNLDSELDVSAFRVLGGLSGLASSDNYLMASYCSSARADKYQIS